MSNIPCEPTISVIDELRLIVERKQFRFIHGVLVDLFTASAIVQIYDALSPDNQHRFMDFHITRIADITWKLFEKVNQS
jgi:hypothetical protein